MRTFSITGIRLRRRVRTTVPDPATSPVADLFQRDFTASEPGRKYMGDITYLPLAGGKFGQPGTARWRVGQGLTRRWLRRGFAKPG
ncbi:MULTISPECIES: hypothetical protein [unclassified Streptomyces]|jgi:transposase InsO family protein|uniref:hypothetical protein n=1 Tax=unclassified Streptomyces TaxID=2593676 RepID=UPI0033B970D6